MGDSVKFIEIHRYRGAMPTTITIAGIARGIRHKSSKGRRRRGSFKCTQIAVGTIRKRIRAITINAVNKEREIAIIKSGCDGIILQESKFLDFPPKPNCFV
jgi:hypothetical protein